MPNSNIIFYGTNWCWDCRRTRKYLDKNQIPYEWIDINKDKQGEQFVFETNDGMRSVPTLLFPDGSTLTEPSNNQLADKLGT